ncbi:hypothetical protein [Peribacillus loiseleuriae]|uniref:hypothetical protein n=1 Tax=Peribacillus loiseleuriae TaxID=1679170 RepID=UPI003D0950DF
MYYAMIELKYSPSELRELYEAPRAFKAFLYANIGFKLDQIAKEAAKAGKGGK